MKINYHNRSFRAATLSDNSQLDSDSIFVYQQTGNILHCNYSGGEIIRGHLIGIVDANGNIDMRYHQVTKDGMILSGICHSSPTVSKEGKITLHEKWQWTSGAQGQGESILEEI